MWTNMQREQRVSVWDSILREYHLHVQVADLIPNEVTPLSEQADWIVVMLEYSDPVTGRPRRKTVRIPTTGF